jgi:hypothetical protein
LHEAGVFPIPRFTPALVTNQEEPEIALPLAAYRETTAGCGVLESGVSSRTNPKAGGNDAE